MEVQAMLASGQGAAALARTQAATEANPKDPQARFLLGWVLLELRKDDEAMQVFKQLAQQYPELPDPLNNIALLHVRANELLPAREALEAALRNDPTHRLARANLAEVHLLLAAQAWQQLESQGALPEAEKQRLKALGQLLQSASR